MAQAEATAEGVWTAFRSLSPGSREQFLERMVGDATLRQDIEDLLDLAMARERSSEPVRPLDDVLAELEK